MCTDDLLLLHCCVEQRVPRKSTLSAAYVTLQTQSLLDVCHERAKGRDGLCHAVTPNPQNIARDANDVNINIEMQCQVRNKHSFSAVRHRTLAAAVQECVHTGKWIALCTDAARNKR